MLNASSNAARTTGPTPCPAGFTLVELLVVIATIGVLISLLLPAIQSSRESARRSACQNHLRQLAVASLDYESSKRAFPPGVRQDFFPTPPVYRGSSLFVHLLPHLEQSTVRQAWDFGDPVNNALGGDGALTATVLPILLCPSDPLEENPVRQSDWLYALTSYAGNGGTRSYPPNKAGVDGVFHTTGSASEPQPDQAPVRTQDVTDGTSHTLLLGERSHDDPNHESFAQLGKTTSLKSWGWWAPSGGRRSVGHVTLSAEVGVNYRIDFTPADASTVGLHGDRRLSAFGSSHPGGANFSLADGSTRFFDDSIPLELLQALATRAGEEIAEND